MIRKPPFGGAIPPSTIPSSNIGSINNSMNSIANKSSSTNNNLIRNYLIILCVGFVIGHWHGRTFGSGDGSGGPINEDIFLLAQKKQISSQDGWSSVDVYYGNTDHSVAKLPPDQQWFAQAHQDQAVLALLGKNAHNGYFVDLAANDATTLSNTYNLERDHGWRGLCIEPNPMYWYNLTHYRPNCQLVSAVIGNSRTAIDFYYEGGDHGGIVGFDNGVRHRSKSLKEYTIPLIDVFERYNVPKEIDYLSLDVEGAEEFIMASFPLDKYQIKLMTVERAKDGLVKKLEEHGYEKLCRLSRWGETLWAHKSVIPQLDMKRLDEFDAKKIREREQEAAKQAALAGNDADNKND